MSAAGGVERREMSLALALIAAFLWLVARPYQGLYHDATIYALFAGNRLQPAAYARDIFFLFGSQDDFSLFSLLYAQLAAGIGLAAAAKAIVLCSGALWLWVSLFLARTWLGEEWPARLCALILITAGYVYSPNFNTFAVHENFATARSLAIPLATISVAAAFAGRRILALAIGILASALHPLFGVWALICWVSSRLDDRLLLVLLGAVFGVVLTGHAWLPLDSLQVMEPEWAAVARASSGDVFPGGWGVLKLGEILFWIGVLWLGGRHGSAKWRRACLVLALLCSTAILLSMLCSYFLPVRLVVQVQLWRIMWLAMLFGTAVLCQLAAVAWRSGLRQILVFGVIAAFAWSFENLRAGLPYVAMLVWARRDLGRMWESMLQWFATHQPIAVAALLVFVASLIPVYYLSVEIRGASLFLPWLALPPAVAGLLFGGGAGLGLALFAVALDVSWLRRLLIVLALPGCVLALSAWDARGPAHVRLEAAYLPVVPKAVSFGTHVAKGDVVVWPEHPLETWFVLGASNYASGLQAIGLVFSAERAKEMKRRLERLSIAAALAGSGPQAEARARQQAIAEILGRGGDLRNVHNFGSGSPTADGISYLCEDPQLDWVVSVVSSVGSVSGHAVDAGGDFNGRYYLYGCRTLRERASG